MTKRFERKVRKGIKFTERDRDTIEAVFEARYLINQMVGRLFYPRSASWCRQRLRYLFDRGFVKKRKAFQNEPDIYYLGLRGRNYIAKRHELPREYVDKIAGVGGQKAAAPMLMMKHELTISRLYVAARLEAATHGWELVWRNDRMLELEGLPMRPDAGLEVVNGGKSKAAFIEFTAVMPTVAQMEGKLEGYYQFWEETKKQVPILWLTTSRNKADRLRQIASRFVYRDFILIGLIDQAGSFLTRPIWSWCQNQEQVSFLPQPNVLYQAGQTAGDRR